MKKTLWLLGIIGFLYPMFKILPLFQKNTSLINSGPVFSPQGNKILISLNYPWKRQGQLYEIDLDGHILQRITRNRKDNIYPAYSKDGNKLVYIERNSLKEDSGTKIILRDLKTKKNKTILNSNYADYSPSFSSDGTKLVFSRSIQLGQEHMGFEQVWRGWNIYYLDLNTKEVVQVTSNNYYQAFLPTFVNQDKEILFFLDDPFLIKNKVPKIYHVGVDLNKEHCKTLKVEPFFLQDLNFFRFPNDEKKLFYIQGPVKLNKHEYGYRLAMTQLENKQEQVLFSSTQKHPISSFDVSQDGSKLIFITETGEDRTNYYTQLFFLDLKTQKVKQIKIKLAPPWQQVLKDLYNIKLLPQN